MARGSKGGLVGRAGAVELADQRRWLHEEALRKLDAERLHREAAEITEENDLIRMAIAMEGESFFRCGTTIRRGRVMGSGGSGSDC